MRIPPSLNEWRQCKQALAGLGSEIVPEPPVTYFDLLEVAPEQAAQLVSADQVATLIPVAIASTGEEVVEQLRAVAHSESIEGFTVEVAGNPVMEADFTNLAEEDLRRGEAIGVAAALIVLVIVFASLIAPLLPIVMGITAIVSALGLVSLIGQIGELNLFVTNMISMIGLAVGIDYSLFIVSRYREERRHGRDKLEAIAVGGATANRAVFFSGLTVVLALVGMYIVPATLFRSLATGAILVTVERGGGLVDSAPGAAVASRRPHRLAATGACTVARLGTVLGLGDQDRHGPARSVPAGFGAPTGRPRLVLLSDAGGNRPERVRAA